MTTMYPCEPVDAESYDVLPTLGGCRLTWTLALTGKRPTNVSLAELRPVLNVGFRLFLRNLAALASERCPA